MKTKQKQLTPKWYSAKYDRVFKSVVVDDEDHSIMEAILSFILEEKVEILMYQYGQMKRMWNNGITKPYITNIW